MDENKDKSKDEEPELPSDIGSGKYIQEILNEGLPPDAEKKAEELLKKPPYPTNHCLFPNEIYDLNDNNTVTLRANVLMARIRHMINCPFCMSFPQITNPSELIKQVCIALESKLLSEESIKKHLQFYEEKVLPAMTHLSFSEMEALQNNRELTVPAMHIVAKTWHVAECDSGKDLLTAAGLFP